MVLAWGEGGCEKDRLFWVRGWVGCETLKCEVDDGGGRVRIDFRLVSARRATPGMSYKG